MALDKRNTLSEEEIKEKSALIKAHLENLDSYQKSNTVMVYLNFRSEVLTDDLIENLFKQGKKVVVPISIKGTRTLLLSEIKSLSDDLELDFYNIRVPKKESIKEVSPADIDFVITPGVAFSKDKYRMGYGGGYYDTFIEKLRADALTCALAFDVQIFDKIPKEEEWAFDHYEYLQLYLTKVLPNR